MCAAYPIQITDCGLILEINFQVTFSLSDKPSTAPHSFSFLHTQKWTSDPSPLAGLVPCKNLFMQSDRGLSPTACLLSDTLSNPVFLVKINLSEHIKELRPLQWTTQVAINGLPQEAAQVHCLHFCIVNTNCHSNEKVKQLSWLARPSIIERVDCT